MFCEGKEEKSLDQELLRAWFNDRNTALIPVGGCENVKRCAAAFQTSTVVSGFVAEGIIDRDHWPDEILNSIPTVHVLPVHEVESLFVLKPVYAAIASHLGRGAQVEALYETLLSGFKKQMTGTIATKLICERYKARSMMLLERGFSTQSDFHDRSMLRAEMICQLPQTRAVLHPGELWDEEQSRVDAALASDDSVHFLKVLPGKPLVGPAASSLGITKERYCELIKVALTSNEAAFAAFRSALESALDSYLPPRHFVPK